MKLPTLTNILPKLAIAGAILVALAIAAAAIYYAAYSRGNSAADLEISEYERKVAELNADLVEKQSEISSTIIREFHTNTIERERVVYQNATTIAQAVPDREALSNGWVYAHNQVAAGETVDAQLASDSSPSNVDGNNALQIINVNYSIAQQNAAQLTALQDWVRQQEEASEEATVTD